MQDRAAADRTGKLLLWFVRDPLRYRGEVRRRDAPPLAGEIVLKLALGRPVAFDNPELSRISATALRDAAAAYVRQVLFRPDATPYQTLGLPPGASAPAIKENFRLLMQLVHPDRQDAKPLWPDAFAARANHAYAILRNDESRAALDREEEERGARLRATQHKAAAAAKTPDTPWLPVGRTTRRPPPRPVLPEWLTNRVGGFARQHPAVVAFVVLLGGAALVIGAMTWEGQAGSLTRDAHAPPALVLPSPQATAHLAATPPGMAEKLDVPAAPPAGDDGGPVSAVTPSVAAEARTAPIVRVAGLDRSSAAPAQPVGATMARETPRTSATISGAAPGDSAAAGASVPAPPAAVASPIVIIASSAQGGTPPPAAAPIAAHAATSPPPTTAEIDALSAAFVDAYDRGRLDAFAALFDDDADSNLLHGRAAIRDEYGELFRLSQWRRMQLNQVNWKRVGERAYAKGEIAVRIGWRDGREVEQRVAVDIEVARRDGRVVITRLAHQPSAP